MRPGWSDTISMCRLSGWMASRLPGIDWRLRSFRKRWVERRRWNFGETSKSGYGTVARNACSLPPNRPPARRQCNNDQRADAGAATTNKSAPMPHRSMNGRGCHTDCWPGACIAAIADETPWSSGTDPAFLGSDFSVLTSPRIPRASSAFPTRGPGPDAPGQNDRQASPRSPW